MYTEEHKYIKFTAKSRLDKAVNSLLGIIEGIAIDGLINAMELNFLEMWLAEHAELRERHPFNELIPVVEIALADRILTEEEREDITWLCERLRSDDFYDKTTADLQRLHAILGSIIADTEISEMELRGLSQWLDDHDHLRSCWPYDEIGSLITNVLSDKKIDAQEHQLLYRFFSEFVALLDGRTIVSAPLSDGDSIVGLCAVCPDISFAGSKFCFTGTSSRYTRSELVETVSRLGGEVVPSPSGKVNYLVIGADGNPCWAYACYGRKVEKAVALRKAGVRILIIHEHDFHDAVSDT